MNRRVRIVIYWVFVGITALLLWQVVRGERDAQTATEITYSDFVAAVQAGDVATVSITGSEIHGRYHDGRAFRLTGPSNPGIYLDALNDKKIEIVFHDAAVQSLPLQLLGTWAPMILLGALWFWMIRTLQRKRSGPPGTMPSGGGSPGPGIGPT